MPPSRKSSKFGLFQYRLKVARAVLMMWRILHARHAHVPFQSVGLGRFGKVGRTDIGGVHTGIAHKDVGLGMETLDVSVIGDTDFRVGKFGKLLYGLRLGRPAIGRRDDAQPGAFALAELFQVIQQQSHAGEFQERDDEINLVGTGDFPPDFLAQRKDTVSTRKQVAHPEAGLWTDGFRTAVLLQQALLLGHHLHQEVGSVGYLHLLHKSVLRQYPVDQVHPVVHIFRILQLLPDGFCQVIGQDFGRFGGINLFAPTNQLM